MWRRAVFLLLVGACMVTAARLAERHAWQFDVTEQRRNSLSAVAHEALERLGPGLELLAFVPDLPISRGELAQRLAPYLAHPSQPRLRFIDPIQQPDRAAEMGMRRQGELHVQLGERREVLGRFTTTAFDQALNRLALRGDRWIVHLAASGARAIDGTPLGLGALAELATQSGYRMLSLDPRRIERLPDNAAVVLLAAPHTPLAPDTTALLEAFLERGGRLLWLAGDDEPWLADRFGISRLPGVVVDADAARFGLDTPANAVVENWPDALLPHPPEAPAVLYRAAAVGIAPPNGWSLVGELHSSAQSWNESGPLTGRLRRDPAQAEQAGPLTVGLALEAHGDPLRRVLYLGSAHALSNAYLGRLGNRELALGLLHWLTDNAMLLVETGTPSHEIRWTPRTGLLLGVLLMWLLPAAYLGTGLWLRRQRRRH